jgi:hypothetical protein
MNGKDVNLRDGAHLSMDSECDVVVDLGVERALLRCAASCLNTRQTTVVVKHCRLTIALSYIISAIDSLYSHSRLVSFTAPDASQAPSPRAPTRSSSRDCYARRHHLHRTRIKQSSLCTSMRARRILPSSDSEQSHVS